MWSPSFLSRWSPSSSSPDHPDEQRKQLTVEPTVVETPVREQPLGAGSLETFGDNDDDDNNGDDDDYDGDEYEEDKHSHFFLVPWPPLTHLIKAIWVFSLPLELCDILVINKKFGVIY